MTVKKKKGILIENHWTITRKALSEERHRAKDTRGNPKIRGADDDNGDDDNDDDDDDDHDHDDDDDNEDEEEQEEEENEEEEEDADNDDEKTKKQFYIFDTQPIFNRQGQFSIHINLRH